MKIGLLRAEFYLHGCASLKEKRQRLGRLRDKFGKQTVLAVCESRHADDLRRGEWSFVATATSGVVVQQTLAEVERYLSTSLDAEIVSLERQWLA
jgi:uncharacterized protein YlxP (DUF503 family)